MLKLRRSVYLKPSQTALRTLGERLRNRVDCEEKDQVQTDRRSHDTWMRSQPIIRNLLNSIIEVPENSTVANTIWQENYCSYT